MAEGYQNAEGSYSVHQMVTTVSMVNGSATIEFTQGTIISIQAGAGWASAFGRYATTGTDKDKYYLCVFWINGNREFAPYGTDNLPVTIHYIPNVM